MEYHARKNSGPVSTYGFWTSFRSPESTIGAYHTPSELLDTLQFAYSAGFDYVYIEQVKALMDGSYALTEYGQKVSNSNTGAEPINREIGGPHRSTTTSSDSLMVIGGRLTRRSFRTILMDRGLQPLSPP